MSISKRAKDIHTQISQEGTKLGDLRKIAKEIKRDHELAMELWTTANLNARLLAILIMDKKLITQEFVDQIDMDIQGYDADERNQVTDWFMANQLMKDKKTIALIESWENHPSRVLRRIFWYYQGRLRWSTKTPPDNAPTLLSSLEKSMASAEPEVQWAMNFTVAQIGINEPEHRDRCISFAEKRGLYKDVPVPRGCTPAYAPAWIDQEVAKLK